MNYDIRKDLLIIREYFNLSQEELAEALGVNRVRIARVESSETYPRDELIEMIYEFAFKKGLRLNQQKEMFYIDDVKDNRILLTHASKSGINGELSISKSRGNNDFGMGLYCGESYEKSVSFISKFEKPSIYFFEFNPEELNKIEYKVDTEWMLTIAYFRGRLNEYKDNVKIKKIINKLNNVDYIIAPIADNRMFQIIDDFINGEITDEQCLHSLSATNLGLQYVFISQKAIDHIKILERCFVSKSEREYYQKEIIKHQKLGVDKSKIARIKYRGQGQYIEEMINDGNK